MGGGSKEQTVGYKYYLGMHMINCHGEIDGVIRIRVDDRDAWTGFVANGSIAINQPELFGGESREGGIVGVVDIVPGSQVQGQNDYLIANLDANVPAFRGVAALILRQVYLGLNPYLKRWSSLVQRIHKKSNGSAQWYDSKSAIPSGLSQVGNYTDIELVPYNAFWDYIKTATPGASYSDGNFTGTSGQAPFGDETHPYNDTLLGFPSACNTYCSTADTIWLKKTVNASSQYVKIRIKHDNLVGLWVNGVSVTLSGTSSSWVSEALVLNTGPMLVVVMVADTQPTFDGGNAKYAAATVTELGGSYSIFDMNPSHIVRECLTDLNWGMGYQESDIDDVAFASAADQLFTEGMGLSLIWDRQTRIEDFIQEVIKHIYATLYVDRITGKFVLKLIRNDYVFASLPQLDELNISKIDSYSRPSFGDLVNSVTVNYLETTSNKTQSVTVQDTALVQLQGSVIGTTIQYPGFSNYAIAARAAQRDLVSLSTPLLTCSLTADRSVSNLNVGSVFKLYWPDFSDQVIAMRISGIAFGDGRSNKIKITCMEDIFTVPTTVITSPGDSEWVDPSGPPSPATNVSVLEAPYIELVQRVGQTVIDSSLSTNPDLGHLQVAVGRPGNSINCDVYEDSSGTYTHSFYLDYAPSGLLAIAISQVDTVITLKDYADLDLIVLSSSAQIGSEIVKIIAVSGANITISRGLFDTTPKTHAINTKFISWDNYGGSDNVEYVNSESFNVKVLPISGSGKVAIDDASANNIVFNRRAIRPYLPGQIKIAGSYFPSSLVDIAISMTWAHRNRIQQTGSDYLTFLSDSVTPEVGTTYSIRLYNHITSALLHSIDGLTGVSYSGFSAYTGSFTMRLELWTVRAGYTSFQTFSHIFTLTNITRLTTEVGSTERLLTEAGDTITTE